MRTYSEVKVHVFHGGITNTMKKEKDLQEFMVTKQKPGESIKIFSLRLEQLVNRAYPVVNVRSHDNLRRAFLHNLPSAV